MGRCGAADCTEATLAGGRFRPRSWWPLNALQQSAVGLLTAAPGSGKSSEGARECKLTKTYAQFAVREAQPLLPV